jgi:hypothetical protein
MTPCKITVVLDRTYGKRLLNTPAVTRVWIVDTPVNRVAVQLMRTERPLQDVTTFKFRDEESAEETLLAELDTIDLHHGSYSPKPAYTVLEVVGTAITERIVAGLSTFGFKEFRPTSSGFSADRYVNERE